MRFRVYLLFLLMFILNTSCWSKSTLLTEKHFSAVKQLIANDKDPKQTLLVLDDDDTLTMLPCTSNQSCQYIGGPAWYKWQSQLKPNNPDRVSKTIDGLLSANTLLLDISRSSLVEKDILPTLELAKKRHIRILVATARGYDMLSATERQLQQDHVFKIISTDTIETPEGKNSLPGQYLVKGQRFPVEYQNGVLYLSGQNKGVMLKHFLKQMHVNNNIKHIIFVDDTLKNDQDVYTAFSKDSDVSVDSIHYTYLKKHKDAFLTGKHSQQLQEKAAERWQEIKSIQKKALPGADIIS